MWADLFPSLLAIDVGMPHSVPVGCCETLYLDELQQHQREGLRQRQRAVPAVEQLVEHALDRWLSHELGRPVEDSIKQLYLDVFAVSRRAAHELDAGDPEEVERVVLRAMKRVLHPHVRRLRQLSRELPLEIVDPG